MKTKLSVAHREHSSWGWKETLPGYAIGIFGMIFIVPFVMLAQVCAKLPILAR